MNKEFFLEHNTPIDSQVLLYHYCGVVKSFLVLLFMSYPSEIHDYIPSYCIRRSHSCMKYTPLPINISHDTHIYILYIYYCGELDQLHYQIVLCSEDLQASMLNILRSIVKFL